MSDSPETDALLAGRNFTPYIEPASGKGTVASELAYKARDLERRLCAAEEAWPCVRQNTECGCPGMSQLAAAQNRIKYHEQERDNLLLACDGLPTEPGGA